MSVECAWLVGKDITFIGIHSPTWALISDDPSRFAAPKALRIPLPSWLFLVLLFVRHSRIQEARHMLESVSDTPRTLGRWTLFLAAAFFGDLGKTVSYNRSPTGPSQQARSGSFVTRPSNGGNSHQSSSSIDGISNVGAV
ncbi:unnamed protein product [Polarella glacialis]|uniref:Uncharacterized protein n=1 Tax=Polarella glacialis TaxID=89957 RepID=A0A813EI18_POLGL|nr:unnamed protein product [Polarella glacialis]